jgi:hypothetical protein
MPTMTRGIPDRYRPYTAAFFITLALVAGLVFAFTSPIARRFGLMGTEHILLGFDHLTFLVMLMIVARGVRELIFVATAFTLAHSITLTAATLEWVQASPAWVEPLIIMTIFYVAVENMVTATPKARLLYTFVFGLIHGLGFASALAEGPLPKSEELVALFSFNIGVEIGQILFLTASFILWRKMLRWIPELHARRFISSIVVLLCFYWLWQRMT